MAENRSLTVEVLNRARQQAAVGTSIMSETQEKSQGPKIKVVGKPGCAMAYTIRDFLQRSDVLFEWVAVTDNDQARREAGVETVDDRRLPM